MQLGFSDNGALRARPCAQATSHRSAFEILLTLFGVNLLDPTYDSDLPRDLSPVKSQCGSRVLEQFLRFPRGVVGVEDESFVIEFFEKHESGGGDP